MSLIGLVILSVFGSVGAVYAYTGMNGAKRIYLWCGVLMVAAPFLQPPVAVLAAVEITLATLPFLVERFRKKEDH